MQTSILLLLLPALCLAYTWEQGETDEAASCPGLFCGRTDWGSERPSNASKRYSSCGPCPRGQRSLGSLCRECKSPPLLYDWLYLGFIALFTLLAHWVVIDLAASHRRLSRELLLLHGAALFEVGLSAVLTLLLAEPRWQFNIFACEVHGLADWYPLLHNPSPNYGAALHCTHEIVYPRFSIVYVFLGLCLLSMIIIRPLLASKLLPGRGRNSIYAALYFLPIIAFVHSVLGGVVYYSYPYLTLLSSLVSCAAHFAFKLDQSLRSLLLSSITDSRNLTILLGHWALHAYGILAITELRQLSLHLSLLTLVPLPALFYILTARFTDPARISNINELN